MTWIFLPLCASIVGTSSMCRAPYLSCPAIIAAAVCEPSATCCTSSIFILQPPISMFLSAIERAPPTASTPTAWPLMLAHDASGFVEPSSQSGCSMPQIPTSGTPVFAIWLTIRGEGPRASSISPATTARVAKEPVSNPRTVTSTPRFLKKPSLSATRNITVPKIGGIPGVPMVIFCAEHRAGAPARIRASQTARRPFPLLLVIFLPPRSNELRLLLHFEFGPAGVRHQRRPDVLAQLGKPRQQQRFPTARPGQVDFDDLVDAARPSFQDQNTVPHQDGLVDGVRDEHHGGPGLLPDAQQLELQDLPRLGIHRAERLVHQ